MNNRMEIPNTKTAFAKMVDEDIEKCEEFLSETHDEEEGKALHLELISKYPMYVANFGDSLYNYSQQYGFTMKEYFGGDAMIHNLTVMKNRLIAFKNFGYRNSKTIADSSINIENNLTANQSQTITVTFEEVKQQVREMTGLSEEDTEDTINQLESIKAIIDSQDSKKTKWQKLKPILIWLADKSVDVGTALLPLILKIGG